MSHTFNNAPRLLEEVLSFVEQSSGLDSSVHDSGCVMVKQGADGKTFRFNPDMINEVLQRTDSDGKAFIQVNFTSGQKVLFTDTLVGFKPRETVGLDMSKLPKVVTTPDLLSVYDAIQETLGSDHAHDHEIEVLKKVYQSILMGAEIAGFELAFEKRWFARLSSTQMKASA